MLINECTLSLLHPGFGLFDPCRHLIHGQRAQSTYTVKPFTDFHLLHISLELWDPRPTCSVMEMSETSLNLIELMSVSSLVGALPLNGSRCPQDLHFRSQTGQLNKKQKQRGI